MWKCKTCGCQNPDTCTVCRMCKAAAPYNTTTPNTAQNNTSQRSFTHEGAPKFCGRCGRPIEQGQTSCRHCASTGRVVNTNPVSIPKSKSLIIAMIMAVSAVVVLLVLLLQASRGWIGLQTVQAQTTTQGTTDDAPVQEPSVQSTLPVQEMPSEIPEQKPSSTVPNGYMSPQTKNLYYAYFDKSFGWDNKLENPVYEDATNKYNVYFADVTHDGEAEMLILDNTYGMEGIGLTVYTCQNNSVVGIYTAETYIDPKGSALGIYTSEGESYLLICCYGRPFFPKADNYYYLAMSFPPNGEAYFIIDGKLSVPSYTEPDELSDEYYNFIDEMEQIKSQSYMLFDPRESFVRQSDPATMLG